jgi:hypothetical protein
MGANFIADPHIRVTLELSSCVLKFFVLFVLIVAIIVVQGSVEREGPDSIVRDEDQVYGFLNFVSISLKDLACDPVGRSVS